MLPPANAKKAARRLRAALGASNDWLLLERIQSVSMIDLSSGVVDSDVGSAFVAALRAAGGAPKLSQLYVPRAGALEPEPTRTNHCPRAVCAGGWVSTLLR